MKNESEMNVIRRKMGATHWLGATRNPLIYNVKNSVKKSYSRAMFLITHIHHSYAFEPNERIFKSNNVKVKAIYFSFSFLLFYAKFVSYAHDMQYSCKLVYCVKIDKQLPQKLNRWTTKCDTLTDEPPPKVPEPQLPNLLTSNSSQIRKKSIVV